MSTTQALPLITELEDRLSNSRGLGCLEVGPSKIKLPLKGVNIESRVADMVAQVSINQTFHNPHSDHIEAVYIFPLPGGATVTAFELKVGTRVIKGKVEERAQARENYQQALSQGKRAALMEQERDDVFTVQVGNLPPGEAVVVHLCYAEKLAYFADGTTELRLPLVVAPRYIPGEPLHRNSVGDGVESDTNVVKDASRITPPRLAPGVDPKTALSITVEIQTGSNTRSDPASRALPDSPSNSLSNSPSNSQSNTFDDLSCSQHATRIGYSQNGLKIALSNDDELLDRDFVLRWRIASDKIASNFVYFRDPQSKECWGMVSVMAPKNVEITPIPRDIVFVLDRSGSMNGVKMASAARACSYLLSTMGPSDRFAIQAFDNMVEWMKPAGTGNSGDYFCHADQAGIDSGQKYLREIQARGGTELDKALSEALQTMQKRASRSGRMPVIVILTDGEIGDESRILKRIQQELADNRVFTIGVDTAVNEGFLKRLALIGGGTSTFVEPGAQLEAALSHVSREIGNPLVLDLAIDGAKIGLEAASIAPSRLPDLFEGRSVTGLFRFTPPKPGKSSQNPKISVSGKHIDGQKFSTDIEGKELNLEAIPSIWAKTHILDLEDSFRVDRQKQEQIRKAIVALAVRHSILTKFTAFVVVDEAEVVNADGTIRKVVQPVHMPSRWEMEADPSLTLSGAYGMAPPMMAQMMRPRAVGGTAGAPASGAADQNRYGAGASSGWGAAAPSNFPASVHEDSLSESVRRKLLSPSQPPAAPTPPGSPQPASGSQHASNQGESGSLLKNIANQFSNALGSKAKHSPDPSAASGAPGASGVEPNLFLKALASFTSALEAALVKISQGTLPSAADLEDERLKLLASLSNLDQASSVPDLQRFLRAQMPKLIAALNGATTVSDNLKQFSAKLELELKAAQAQVNEIFAEVRRPFWEAGV